MSIRPKHAQAIFLIAVALICAFFLTMPAGGDTTAGGKLYRVERVVDGDTLKLSGGERVRLIGIDTPELHYSNKLTKDAARTKRSVEAIRALGRRASDFTKKLCQGKRVRLEFDVQKKDRYKRLLAYVYLEDGIFVNARIVEEGLGQVMTIPPNVKYAEYFLKLQQKARKSRKGIWGSEDGS